MIVEIVQEVLIEYRRESSAVDVVVVRSRTFVGGRRILARLLLLAKSLNDIHRERLERGKCVERIPRPSQEFQRDRGRGQDVFEIRVDVDGASIDDLAIPLLHVRVGDSWGDAAAAGRPDHAKHVTERRFLNVSEVGSELSSSDESGAENENVARKRREKERQPEVAVGGNRGVAVRCDGGVAEEMERVENVTSVATAEFALEEGNGDVVAADKVDEFGHHGRRVGVFVTTGGVTEAIHQGSEEGGRGALLLLLLLELMVLVVAGRGRLDSIAAEDARAHD